LYKLTLVLDVEVDEDDLVDEEDAVAEPDNDDEAVEDE